MAETYTTKAVKEIEVGDVICIKDPDGTARVTSIERSRLFRASGGCFCLDLQIISGPEKGKRLTDQHHPGDMEVRLPEQSHATT